MSVAPIERAHWLSHFFAVLAQEALPYVWGGGHGVAPVPGFTFPATKGEDPEGTNPKGYDCMAFQSAALWHAGMLESGDISRAMAQRALTTQEAAGWGDEGPGRFYTLYVRNDSQVHHAIGLLTLPDSPRLWPVARHTGTICGFYPYGSWDPRNDGYDARHFPGL